MRISIDELSELLNNGLINLGCNKQVASSTVHSLVLAEVAGVKTHGLSMLIPHINKIKNNEYNINDAIIIEQENQLYTRINSNNTIGMYSASECMQKAINKAKQTGIHIVLARNCNTFSAAFVYSLLAAEQDCIGIVFSNAPAQMAPINGKTKLLGTNPFSYSIPGKRENPILFDMATSVVAKSKINLAKELKKDIPLGWAVNENGEPTTNPLEALKGFVLPMAGAKGYGLTIMIDVLAGLLSGAQYLDGVGRFYNSSSCMNVGQVFIAINPQLIYGKEFYISIDNYINKIRNSEAIANKKISIPGDNKFNGINKALKYGIEISDSLINNFKKVVYG